MTEKNQAVGAPLETPVMQHTPGPWQWKDGEYPDMPELVSPAGSVCWFGNDEQYYPTCGEPPSGADMALIAAAPDLLAALRNFVDGCSTSVDAGAVGRAAIAKALNGAA
jgi:hypothetical protein